MARDGLERPSRHLIAVLFTAWMLGLLDRLVLVILVPSLKGDLHLSDTSVSLLYGPAFSVFFSLVGLPMGPLVDRTNRRNLLAIGVAGWSLATVGCGLVHTFTGLLLARILVGVFQATLAPASMSMVADAYPMERRGRVTALLIGGATVGGALSNMLGGIALDAFASGAHHHAALRLLAPWQWTFVIAGAPGLVLAALVLTLREPSRRQSAGAGFNALAFIFEHRTAFALIYAALACAYIAGYGVSAWYPTVFMRDLHIPPHQVGLSLGLLNLVAAAIAAFGGGYLSDRAARRDPLVGRFKLIRIVMLVSAASILTLLFLQDRAAVYVGFFLYATLATVISSIAYAMLAELAPSEGRGQVIAIFTFVGYFVGLGLAPTAIALLTDLVFKDEAKVNLAMAAVGAPALIIAAVLIQLALPRARRLREGLMAATG